MFGQTCLTKADGKMIAGAAVVLMTSLQIYLTWVQKVFFSSSVFVCAMVANMLPLLGGNYDNFAFYLRIYNYKKTESFLLFVFIRKYMATRNAKEIDTFVAQT